jgi:hypothetical protein
MTVQSCLLQRKLGQDLNPWQGEYELKLQQQRQQQQQQQQNNPASKASLDIVSLVF